jgi:hypothetical protein
MHTQRELCEKYGCSISQYGWAAHIGQFIPGDAKTERDWVRRVYKAYGGKFPPRIDYRKVDPPRPIYRKAA